MLGTKMWSKDTTEQGNSNLMNKLLAKSINQYVLYLLTINMPKALIFGKIYVYLWLNKCQQCSKDKTEEKLKCITIQAIFHNFKTNSCFSLCTFYIYFYVSSYVKYRFSFLFFKVFSNTQGVNTKFKMKQQNVWKCLILFVIMIVGLI